MGHDDGNDERRGPRVAVTLTQPCPPLDPADELSPAPLWRLGRFDLGRRLGEGGMGVVHEAVDTTLGRRVAVKLVRPEYAPSANARARLLREARAMARLSHPHVVTVYETGASGDQQLYIVMELVEGADLREVLRERPSPTRAWAIIEQAGRGLLAAHRAGLVHRDFKPANVLVDRAGVAKVSDFGLARDGTSTADALEAESPPGGADDLTRSGQLLGTPAYMAPEQHEGGTADSRSDQFAFCVVLYEGLFGCHPFPAASWLALADRVRRGDVAPPPDDPPLPADVMALLRRGLAYDAGARFADMDELLQALRAVLDPALAPSALARAHLRGVWDDAMRARLRAGFRASNRFFSVELGQRSVEALDEYAGRWVQAYAQALAEADAFAVDEAARGRAALRRLDRCASGLSAVTQILCDEPAGDAIDRSLEMVRHLPAPERPPAGAPAGAEVSSPRQIDWHRRLIAARVSFHAGQIARSRDEAARVATEAAAARELAVEAEARMLAASMSFKVNDLDAVERHLERALEVAAEAGDDATIATAWGLRAIAEAELRGRPTQALIMAQAAAVAARRTDDELARGRAFNDVGGAYFTAGHLDEALGYFERAIEAKRRALGADHPDVVGSMYNRAVALEQLGRNELARAEFERAQELVARLLGPAHLVGAVVTEGLAGLEARVGSPQRGIELSERAAASFERLFGPSHPRIGLCLLHIAEAHLRTGEHDRARRETARALAMLEVLEDGNPDLVRARFVAARALEPIDGEGARTLARQALAGLERGGAMGPLVDELRAWLESRA